MDKEIRNHIQRATQDARALLEQDFGEQLDGVFDIRLDGTIAPEPGSHLDASQRVLHTKLVAAVEHCRSSGLKKAEAVDAYLREAAFTMLNRFVALKMLEARDLVQECITRGEESAGFREFAGLAPGLVQLPDHGYRLYIESLFDEIGCEVRVLFDRRDPASLLWPGRQTLHDLLVILNAPELAEVWSEDETIGWVYQYFNSDDERKKMRAESQAPRNSRELAVRNQFFTPRYVVEFITDNTLGRIWYEMRQGKTRLVDECDYLVRRPNEVFLAKGAEAPEQNDVDQDLTQEELLKRTVFVPFRAKKDPRDIKILDPACGSGHFLLYAFDLLVTIYEEAWEDSSSPVSEFTGRTVRDDHTSLDSLRLTLPGLILRHNLHGIDIDARAAQIAALALWMRAQRSFNDFCLGRGDRSPITKTNVVVAEPMPGEKSLREDFVASLDGQLGRLVGIIFDRLELAGEVGALLDLENEIQSAIQDVYGDSGELFRKTDEARWSEAEHHLLDALSSYAETPGLNQAFTRRLFSEDAARGVAFIDVCRRQYDVVLMNPPFGDASPKAAKALDSNLSSSGRDIGAAFVRAAAEKWARCGTIGALLSAATWFQPVFERWREDLFFGAKSALRPVYAFRWSGPRRRNCKCLPHHPGGASSGAHAGRSPSPRRRLGHWTAPKSSSVENQGSRSKRIFCHT
ncbi:Eco57I restriction-modification methylase domain-containing protein [Myxococcota bacterium]